MTANGARQGGFSYIEVLVAVTILAASLVPMLNAMRTAFVGDNVQTELAQARQRIAARMEEILAESFESLDAAALAAGAETTPSSYSEPAGGDDRVLVYLSRYDGDNADTDGLGFTGVDEGLIWIRVEIEDTAYGLEALTAL